MAIIPQLWPLSLRPLLLPLPLPPHGVAVHCLAEAGLKSTATVSVSQAGPSVVEGFTPVCHARQGSEDR